MTEEGTPAPEGEAKPGDTPEDEIDWKAEAEKHKALSRKHEDRAKTNAAALKELEELKRASMDDQAKAVDLARTEARTEVLREVGGKLVSAEVRAAAAGRNVDVDALLEGLDPTRFLDADGDPDRDQIVAWIDRVAPAREEDPSPSFPDLGQGTRTESQHMALNGDPIERKLKEKLGIR